MVLKSYDLMEHISNTLPVSTLVRNLADFGYSESEVMRALRVLKAKHLVEIRVGRIYLAFL